MNPEHILAGDRRALARWLTALEDERREAQEVLAALFAQTGRAQITGVTGAPGSGKSTLVAALARGWRARGQTVAILAVDPSSPFSGGAILGDRVRMQALSGDPGVFIRSMASRGALGGLAATTADLARALDAAGFDQVVIETVGAGQSEIDVARAAQTTIVIEAPGLGDDIQAIKAGILEIADLLVVTKADQPGAEATVRALRAALELESAARSAGVAPGWAVPVLTTIAPTSAGVSEVLDTLAAHQAFLRSSGAGSGREVKRLQRELELRLRQRVWQRFALGLDSDVLAEWAGRIHRREIDLESAVKSVLASTHIPEHE
ncbi:MAG TPA: methylmalonyl Co-A mutase-associated GTPase MeaB [Anaerolineales bacterium]|nr:methylmalonyl Co-A mutase-associated GTPase MeaB [Anaerolineales bacterium]